MSGTLSNGLGGGEGVISSGDTLATGLASPDYHLPFFHYLTIPKNTTQSAYLSYTLVLPIGKVNKLWLEFPKGCAGLAGIQLFRSVQQIFPLPAGNWLRSDNSVLNFAFTHEIMNEPYEIEIRGYNLDDTYQHTIWIGLEMSGLAGDLPPQLQSFFEALKG